MSRVILVTACVLSQLVVVVPVADGANPQIDWKAVVESLASRNKPPTVDPIDPTRVEFGTDFDQKEEYRIQDAVDRLCSHFSEAIPLLVQYSGDKRYCATLESGDGVRTNASIGDVCVNIICKNVEPEPPWIRRGTRGIVEQSKSIVEWWRPRQKRALYELQLEAYEFALRQELLQPLDSSRMYGPLGTLPPEKAERKIIGHLCAAIARLCKFEKPLHAERFLLRPP